ncbi:hypothetical protein BCL65_10333 [Isoptericola halotolerans]|uniref:Uncharacterized protein n=1 Tax=Isoptericola halotolerans TaxID=300560 RepID=A0ABX5EFI3_9MICO|nr:hypothetical protein BCL65_10333 [Isoptericola halotolerans]
MAAAVSVRPWCVCRDYAGVRHTLVNLPDPVAFDVLFGGEHDPLSVVYLSVGTRALTCGIDRAVKHATRLEYAMDY